MDVESSRVFADRLILDLARRQHGCVARWQLLPLGVSREMIAVRLRQGRLIEIHRGVYLVGAVRSEHTLSADLAARDVRVRSGLRVTSPPRTVLDCSALIEDGLPGLRRVLAVDGGPQRTRSNGERAFLRLLREYDIAGFQANSKVFGPELDFVWETERFAVELDGWDGHSSRPAFERDRLKVAELASRGVQVMPVTGRQILKDRGKLRFA